MAERKFNPDSGVVRQNALMHFAIERVVDYSVGGILKVEGVEHLPTIRKLRAEGRPGMIMVNHSGHADGPVLLRGYRRAGFHDLADNTSFAIGSMIMADWRTRWLVKAYQGYLLPAKRQEMDIEDRRDMRDNGVQLIIDAARRGELIGMYPEGSRSRDGKLRQVSPNIAEKYLDNLRGGFVQAAAEIDMQKILKPDKSITIPHRFPATVRFGAPILIDDMFEEYAHLSDSERHQRMMDKVMYAIAELLPEENRGYYSTDEARGLNEGI